MRGFKIKMLYLWLLKKFMSLPGQLQQFLKTLWPHSDCWSFSSDTLLLYFSCFYTLCSVFVPNSNGWWVWDWVTMTDCFPALCGGETDTHTQKFVSSSVGRPCCWMRELIEGLSREQTNKTTVPTAVDSIYSRILLTQHVQTVCKCLHVVTHLPFIFTQA